MRYAYQNNDYNHLNELYSSKRDEHDRSTDAQNKRAFRKFSEMFKNYLRKEEEEDGINSQKRTETL